MCDQCKKCPSCGGQQRKRNPMQIVAQATQAVADEAPVLAAQLRQFGRAVWRFNEVT